MGKIIKFSDYKEEILKSLQNNSKILGVDEKLTLIDGFMNQPIFNELDGNMILGGQMITIPIVSLVGESGKIYFFALKSLLPNIEL